LGAFAVLLLALGAVFAVAYRVASGSERHSYSAGAVPPGTVTVTAGRTYQLAVPGGAGALQDRGLDPAHVRCSWSTPGTPERALHARMGEANSKATNVIGTFVSPFSGAIHVDCRGWGAVFVDDADNASTDVAGLFLVLCIAALTLGAALGLSTLRSRRQARASVRAPGEQDQVKRGVHVGVPRAEDGEIGGTDRGDIAP
jgi:hypothetical protein